MTMKLHIILVILLLFFLVAACSEQDEGKEVATPSNPPEPLPTACPGELTFADDSTSFTFASEVCGVGVEKAGLRLGWWSPSGFRVVKSSEYPKRTVEETPAGYRWILSGHLFAPELQVEIDVGSLLDRLTLWAQVIWPSDRRYQIELAWFELPAVDNPEAGITISSLAEQASWIQNGYDSWMFTGVESLRRGESLPFSIYQPVPTCANNCDYFSTCHGVSWWMGGLAGQNRLPGLLWGALSARHWKTLAGGWLTADGRIKMKIVQGTPGDERLLSPGDAAPMEPIWLMLAARPAFDLRQYAEAAAREVPPLDVKRTSPFGWATWYYYFFDIDQEIVLDNCARMRRLFPDETPLLCQIDDGYQTLVGDWTDYLPGFPDGIAAVADEIRSLGMLPGIWLAPLLVDTRSDLVAEHPEWFLFDEQGAPVSFIDIWVGKSSWVLDVTVPEAADHLRRVIEQKVDEGYSYFKFDFLFAGAYEGQHADGSTSMEAYHRAMGILQEAAGEAYILASGQPWLPTLGHTHAARDSSDITGSFPGVPLHTTTANLARYHSVRAVVDGVWYANDPDNLLVRRPLIDSQAEVAVAATYLAGSSNLSGDNLLVLSNQRTSLLTSDEAELLRKIGRHFWAVDLMERPVAWPIASPIFDLAMVASNPPRIWVRSQGEERVLALFAWGLLADHLVFSDRDLDLSADQEYEITHLFGVDADLQRDANGSWLAVVPVQSVSVVRLAPK